MNSERRQELQELHERLIFFVQRAKINSYLPLFFLLSAILYAGFLYVCHVVFPPVTRPGVPGRIYHIDSEQRRLLPGLDSRAALKRSFPAWADPARSAHNYVQLETEEAPSLRPLPPLPPFASLVYSPLQTPQLPDVSAENTAAVPLAPAKAPAILAGVPASWGPLKKAPVDDGKGDPGWIGRKASFLVVLGADGAPEQSNLMESSGAPEADRAAAAYLRTARWPASRTPRSALISVTWKEDLP